MIRLVSYIELEGAAAAAALFSSCTAAGFGFGFIHAEKKLDAGGFDFATTGDFSFFFGDLDPPFGDFRFTPPGLLLLLLLLCTFAPCLRTASGDLLVWIFFFCFCFCFFFCGDLRFFFFFFSLVLRRDRGMYRAHRSAPSRPSRSWSIVRLARPASFHIARRRST